jgi:hypothetical protein
MFCKDSGKQWWNGIPDLLNFFRVISINTIANQAVEDGSKAG